MEGPQHIILFFVITMFYVFWLVRTGGFAVCFCGLCFGVGGLWLMVLDCVACGLWFVFWRCAGCAVWLVVLVGVVCRYCFEGVQGVLCGHGFGGCGLWFVFWLVVSVCLVC